MNKFYVKDCPENFTMFNWIYKNSNWKEAEKDVKSNIDNVIKIPHSLNLEKIINDTKIALEVYGTKGWQTQLGESKAYGGLSMVYNPDLVSEVDPNQSTLGTIENKPNEFYYDSVHNFRSIRNTYFDSYGFRKLSPCIENTKLVDFVAGFKLSLTRSRIAVLDADYHDRVGEDFLWHKDETVFENLRINIPIETDRSFMFQLGNNDPIHLSIGDIYTWDTHKPHRVYATNKNNKKRIHMVLGFTPWVNYLQDEDAYELNDFFGKVHPFDIILNGKIHDQIGIGH
jgi:hypothetical protein